jgi:hypothetical protein
MHGSKLLLTVWFWAAYLMATHSNGIAALQLQKQLGLGSYKSAYLCDSHYYIWIRQYYGKSFNDDMVITYNSKNSMDEWICKTIKAHT